MEKKIIREEISNKHYNGICHAVRFSDLPKDIKAKDIIDIRREEAHYSENNSWDAFTEVVVIREREETDEEYKERIAEAAITREELKKRRHETYLKLKAEFEPNAE